MIKDNFKIRIYNEEHFVMAQKAIQDCMPEVKFCGNLNKGFPIPMKELDIVLKGVSFAGGCYLFYQGSKEGVFVDIGTVGKVFVRHIDDVPYPCETIKVDDVYRRYLKQRYYSLGKLGKYDVRVDNLLNKVFVGCEEFHVTDVTAMLEKIKDCYK